MCWRKLMRIFCVCHTREFTPPDCFLSLQNSCPVPLHWITFFMKQKAILEMAFDALRKQLVHCLHAIEIHMQHFLECTMSIDERHSTLGYKVSCFRLLIIVPWMSMYLLSVSSLSLPFSYASVLWHLKFCTFILQAFDSKTCSVEYNHCHIYFHILLMLLLNSCSYASFQNTYSLLKTSYSSCT